MSVSLTVEIFWEGLKTGLVTFGGAYTAVPFLQDVAVDGRGWLTESQFLDGLAIGGILPAPLIIFSTFVGYLAGGLAGSVAITLGIFLPAFVLPIFFHRQLVALAENSRVRPFLLGVAAGVIGVIAAVTVDIVDAGVVDLPTALLAIAAFLVLTLWHAKLTVLWVMLGCGAAGAVLQLSGVCNPAPTASLNIRYQVWPSPKEEVLPIVTIEQSPRELEPKRRLVAAITEAFVDAYGVSPEHVQVFIHEVDHENWAKGGKLAVDR